MIHQMTPPTAPCWQHQLWDRLRERWLAKFVCISASITAFMGLYFWLLRHPMFPVTLMPRVALDRLIPFTPWAVIPYASLWLYIGLVPALLHVRGEMPHYAVTAVGLGLIGCVIFLLFPTAIPPAGIDWAHWPMVAFLKSTDASGNACPSLHVAYSTLTLIWMAWLLRRVGGPRWLHTINIAWCLTIVWSTIATRQHVVLDAAAGAALGGTVALLALYAWPAWRARQRPATC